MRTRRIAQDDIVEVLVKGSQSAIEWGESIWNVITGCDRTSPGCAHCHPAKPAPRPRAIGVRQYVTTPGCRPASGLAFGVSLQQRELDWPQHWRRPRRIFVCSTGEPGERIGER